jgi:hypothetical protein|tara:strand:- start:664 stop:879 length:216 start_codon:yes stop_codon:yes gene_type:complete
MQSKEQLGAAYSDGCTRMHDVITSLYENLFDETGDVKVKQEDIEKELSRCLTKIRYEADYVRESLKDYNGE